MFTYMYIISSKSSVSEKRSCAYTPGCSLRGFVGRTTSDK